MSEQKNELTSIIKALIRESGPITFARFMELALYHPEYGYYSSGRARIGKEGDYYTSPYVHPAFGETLGRFIHRAYEVVDAPDFTVVEMGAGKGFLALDVLDSLKRTVPNLYDRINYLIVERNPHSHEEGEEVLQKHLHKIKWIDSYSNLKPGSISGVFISNELVDSLPFHRAKFKNGRFFEILVALTEEDFLEVLSEPSRSDLETYFEGYNLGFEEEQEIEINLEAGKWLRNVAYALDGGFIVTVDYGYLAPELFSPARMKGTFRCFYKHTVNENPYINVGNQDITVDVDFSNLIRLGESLGLDTVKYTTQGQFLIDWGILDIAERYSAEEADNLSAQRNRMAIKNLILPELMGGRFKVLIQGKNLGGGIETFYPESPFRMSFQKTGEGL
ncbi:MAG TPA: SAM-dependent methyltransferase [Thermodesulfobacteriota bacterium]|nr:SAM-dependent methyltransferase [Thermodesulfobacteriota bacterium]